MHVVAAALQGHADVIVTANLKDFPKELLAPYGFEIQSPDEFLVHQFHLNPFRVLAVLDDQASALNKQRSYVVERLQRALPNFGALLNRP